MGLNETEGLVQFSGRAKVFRVKCYTKGVSEVKGRVTAAQSRGYLLTREWPVKFLAKPDHHPSSPLNHWDIGTDGVQG